jgi:hypothetical protein
MLAIQEWQMANEGLDTEPICPRCRSTGIQPITTTADHQPCGNPRRAVRFFCAKCRSAHDDVALNPLPPCPLPLSVLQAMRAAAKGTLPSISFLVDYDTPSLETCAREQPPRKSVGTDRIPRELYKYGLRPFLELLRAAINAYLKGERPTVHSHEWMGAILGAPGKAVRRRCGIVPVSPNHDRVQPVAAVKRFLQKGVALHPWHSFVFVVAQHQTVGVQVIVVRCGSSARGPWDGPVICNKIRLVCDT